MSTQQLSAQPTRVLRIAAIACFGMAVVAAAAGVVSAHPVIGVGIAVGLVLGAANGFVLERLVMIGVPFLITSISRLFFLTLVALAAALILGFRNAWPVVLGIAFAQLALAGSALREVTRR